MTALWDDDVRALRALEAGHALVRRRRTQAGAAALGVLAAAGLTVLVVPRTAPSSTLVLGCTSAVGSSGSGTAAATPTGVALPVVNPTSEVLAVSGGGATVLAVPGRSVVTLPIASGTTTVTCGSGRAVRLRVDSVVAGHCAPVDAAVPVVQRGGLRDLTLAAVAGLPADAAVTVSGTALRHVTVRAGGALVAEAVWHEMPGVDDWHLQSLSRCT